MQWAPAPSTAAAAGWAMDCTAPITAPSWWPIPTGWETMKSARADHVAFVALAQPAVADACTALPSILDMTKADCRKDQPVKALTAADTGYLSGLYKIDPGASLS